DLLRRDVLALPAKRVTDAVDEIEVALRVPAHQVAGAEPGVARLEHVAQDLFLRRPRVRVAVEAAAAILALDSADRLADLVVRARDGVARRVAHRLALLRVEPDDGGREAMRQERRDTADRAGLALRIVEREVAFRGGVEFEDRRDAEALLEAFPHVCA